MRAMLSEINQQNGRLLSNSKFLQYLQEDRENILRARSTGNAVLTRPFRLLGSHHLGVVLTFPVYKFKLEPNPSVEERIEATAGYSIYFFLCT